MVFRREALDEIMEIRVVNAFSKDGGGGNPAGVVMEGNLFPGDVERCRLAARLGFSETVFCDGSDKADMKLSYFTPEGEVPLCGHATIAFFVLLQQLGKAFREKYTVETKAGIIEVVIGGDGVVMMSQCLPEFSSPVPLSELSVCFAGFEPDLRWSPQVVSTGLRDIMLPVVSPEVLFSMKPDFGKIAQLSKKYDCVGVHAFALTEMGNALNSCMTGYSNDHGKDMGIGWNTDSAIAVCRNFAPLYGIDEEAATGTSNGALASYLFMNGIRSGRYIFRQGYNLDCVSEILVEIISEDLHAVSENITERTGMALVTQEAETDLISSVRVGGRGYVSFRNIHDVDILFG